MFFIPLVLSILFAVPIIYWIKHGNDDFFAPTVIVSILHIIKIIPFLFIVTFDTDQLSPLVLGHDSIKRIDSTIAYYALLQGIAYIMILLGIKSKVATIFYKPFPLIIEKENEKSYLIVFIFCISISFLAYFYISQKLGGIQYMLSNMQYRSQFSAGNSYLTTILTCSFLAITMLIYSFKFKKSIFKYILLISSIIGITVMFTTFGGRSRTVQLLILALLAWHYGVKRFTRFPWKITLILLPIICLYIVAIPFFRNSEMTEFFLSNPILLVNIALENMWKIFKEVSYLNQYLIIVSYFSPDNIWLGKSFYDLFTAPIPSTILSNKPPVDDGVYLWNIANGNYVEPSKPYSEMLHSSWPLNTFGNMYANFWIPGVFFGMYILGMIYKAAYSYMYKCNFSAFSVICYGYTLFYFEIANLEIVRHSIELFIFSIVLIPFLKYKPKLIKNRTEHFQYFEQIKYRVLK